MTTSCRAAVFAGTPGELELRTIAVPRPAAGQTLVRVLGCTLCGSDLHSYFGRRPTPSPTILGHEIVGEIVELGDNAGGQDLRGATLGVGDRVVWTLVASCGACVYCRNDLPQKCLGGVKYGHHQLAPGRELLGGLAEYCLLLPGTGMVRLSPELSLAEACPMGCATATVCAGLEAAGALAGRRVLMVGAGMLGLTACAMADSLGAAEVVCVDPIAQRRELAVACGAKHVFSSQDAESALRDLTAGVGFDVACEFSGSNAGFHTCFEFARLGGRVVLMGAVFPAPPVEIRLEQVVRRQLAICGVQNYAPRHLAAAVEFVETHRRRFPLAQLVDQWAPLEMAAEAFRRAAESGAIRVGVAPS